jgi:hypothetical protein
MDICRNVKNVLYFSSFWLDIQRNRNVILRRHKQNLDKILTDFVHKVCWCLSTLMPKSDDGLSAVSLKHDRTDRTWRHSGGGGAGGRQSARHWP